MKDLREKIASGLVLGCLTLSLGTLVFASPQDDLNGPPPSEFCQDGRPGDRDDFIKHIKMTLSQLVTKGTISADQKDALVNFFVEKDNKRKTEIKVAHEKQHQDMLAELTNAGSLSNEQAKAVDDVLRPPMPPGGPRGDMPPQK